LVAPPAARLRQRPAPDKIVQATNQGHRRHRRHRRNQVFAKDQQGEQEDAAAKENREGNRCNGLMSP